MTLTRCAPLTDLAIIKSRQVPDVPVNFVPAQAGEIIKLGPITCRVLEDGSRTGTRAFEPEVYAGYQIDLHYTENRIGVAEFTLPPRTNGPPAHWHEVWNCSLIG